MGHRTALLTGNTGETLFGYAQGVAVDGLVAVSGQVGRDNPTGALVGERTLRDRADQAFRNVRDVASGLAGEDARIVSVQLHLGLSLEEGWDELVAAALRSYGDERPAVTIVPVADLSSPEYLVEISAMATSLPRTTIPDTTPIGDAFASSSAVRVGDQISIAGHLPLDASGAVVGDTIAEQVEVVGANLRATLAELGLGVETVTSTHTWVAKPPTAEEFPAFSAAHRALFGEAKPTATLIYVPELPFGAMVQITATAVAQVPAAPTA